MRSVFRHYRQVKVVNLGDSIKPDVQGVEEIYYNGQRQVRYWGDRSSHLFSAGDAAGDWRRPSYTRPAPRYTPFEVLDGGPLQPSSMQPDSAWQQRMQMLKYTLSRSMRKLQKVFKNVPSALRAAWRELNR